jgi:hypothetical protein
LAEGRSGMTEPERVHIYTATELPCPLCGEPFTVRLEVGAIERLEALGISEEEQLQKIADGLATGRIACKRCLKARQN